MRIRQAAWTGLVLLCKDVSTKGYGGQPLSADIVSRDAVWHTSEWLSKSEDGLPCFTNFWVLHWVRERERERENVKYRGRFKMIQEYLEHSSQSLMFFFPCRDVKMQLPQFFFACGNLQRQIFTSTFLSVGCATPVDRCRGWGQCRQMVASAWRRFVDVFDIFRRFRDDGMMCEHM